MNDVPDNELLSAYLDGELTAAEQAQVERLLAASSAARQLLEELRTLSATLQSMPQQELDEDLSGRVLRMAERQILTEPDQRPEPAPDPPPAPPRSIYRRVLSPRALVWSGLAVAAALLIMVIGRRLEDQRPGREVVTVAGDFKSKAARPPSIGAAPPTAEESPSPRVDLFEARSEPAKAGKAAGKSYGFQNGSAVVAKKGAAGVTLHDGLDELEDAQIDGDMPKRRASNEPALEAGAMKAGRPATPPAGRGVPGKRAQRVAKDEVAPASTAVGGAKAGRLLTKRSDAAGQAAVEDDDLRRGGAVATGLVLVDISPEAARQRTFENLLLANGIDWQETEAQQEVPADGQATAELRFGGLRQRQLRDQTKGERSFANTHDICLVRVEATPAQVKATLADLSRRVEKFAGIVSVSVRPASGVEAQQSWVVFNRRAGQTQAEQVETFDEEESIPAEALAESAQEVVEKEGLPRGQAWPVEDWSWWGGPPVDHYGAALAGTAGKQQPAPEAPPRSTRERLAEQMQQPLPPVEQSQEPLPTEQQLGTRAAPTDQPAERATDVARGREASRQATQVPRAPGIEKGGKLQRVQRHAVLFVLRVVGPDPPDPAASTAEEPATPEAEPAKQ